ncbi:MAG TPA: carboxymuconolactone decarboxylase family protein [Gemmatimonadota bacterium]|nr:carboxymuconolactone decarboxylase family protein [Gemmatimonadota bacterium]
MTVARAEGAAIVGLGAAVANGDRERLLSAFDRAEGVIPADHLEEYLLQTYLFAGFPRAINAFFAWQGWTARTATRREPLPSEPDRPAEWRARGERLCRLVYGESYDALQRRLVRLHPALADWTLVEGYGKVLARPGPDPARRELAAVGALIALGAERQLAAHMKGALNAGVEMEVLAGAVGRVAADWDRKAMVESLLGPLLDQAAPR